MTIADAPLWVLFLVCVAAYLAADITSRSARSLWSQRRAQLAEDHQAALEVREAEESYEMEVYRRKAENEVEATSPDLVALLSRIPVCFGDEGERDEKDHVCRACPAFVACGHVVTHRPR